MKIYYSDDRRKAICYSFRNKRKHSYKILLTKLNSQLKSKQEEETRRKARLEVKRIAGAICTFVCVCVCVCVCICASIKQTNPPQPTQQQHPNAAPTKNAGKSDAHAQRQLICKRSVIELLELKDEGALVLLVGANV